MTLRTSLIAWILTAGALAGQTVEGRVINIATGNGIPGVAVGLLGSGQVDYRATTDNLGHFRLEGVKDGSYVPFYKVPDFSPADARANEFQVKAGAGPVELEYKMSPRLKISGRVLDGSGKPVANATLMLTQAASGGMAFSFEADAHGEYSAPDGVQPGAWLLSATAPPSWTPPEPRDGQPLGWTKTFYPDVTDAALATPVVASIGGELPHLDIKLAAVPVHRVRGVVLDDHGKPALKASVLLTGRIMEGLPAPPQNTNADDGTFEFPSVAEGEYRLSTTMTKDGVRLWTVQPIQMKDRDLEDIELRLTQPFPLPGKVVVEAPEGQVAPKSPGVAMEHVDMSAGLMDSMIFQGSAAYLPATSGVFEAYPDAKGDFTFKNVYPGEYTILPGFAPPGYYLDSIRLGDSDAFEEGVQIFSGAPPITITYKQNGGTVRGTVEDCGGGTVWLVPQEPVRRRDGFILETTCGPGGRFEILAVRPGEYYAFAVAKGLNVRSLELDQTVINQSVRVTIRANEAADADLHVIAR